jgi:hypothetical protein
MRMEDVVVAVAVSVPFPAFWGCVLMRRGVIRRIRNET